MTAWLSVIVAALLIIGIGTAYGYYRSLRGNMAQHDLDSALEEKHRPPKIGDDVTILFIGSDGREAGNSKYGGRDFEGERSDALMLARISPDSSVTVISFPRDSLVRLPECAPYGKADGTGGYQGMINSALFHGGPPCVVKTVESLTGIRVDHFAHLSFVGFRDMVDAVGGVEMCIPKPLRDERAKLDLEAGEQTLEGEEALAFVRARYEIGNGGDIGRIDRQQMFLGALADQVTASDTLSSPGRMDGLLTAISEHTATDKEFDLNTMVSLGSTLADADMDEIAFYTVPWHQAPYNPNRVIWDEEKARELFEAVNSGAPVSAGALETGSPEASESPEATPGSSPSPDGGAGDDALAERLEGRDATSDPCVNGLGEGTGDK
ncbi:LCP family protein [Allosalinactinospora lopnorensis]|uniref:LCP family protein n=1 Tax=Allosalinactinospora lopnorensis TaxID=1352348 RepID=UPI00308468CD